MRELAEAEREAERERSTWAARADALASSLTRKDGGGGAARRRSPACRACLGSVAALLTVEPGYEAAVAAALGAAADAIAVDSLDAALDALTLLKAEDAGRAGLLVGGSAPRSAGRTRPGCRPARARRCR